MVLVDSNVLLDVFTEDPVWYSWSAEKLEAYAEYDALAVNPIIYAELSAHFSSIEELDSALPENYFRRLSLPWESAFLAGRCFLKFRRQGGQKRSPLPDFYIGAHAAIHGLTLLTRDKGRYRTYFPKLEIISP